jgi:hypothetical protein
MNLALLRYHYITHSTTNTYVSPILLVYLYIFVSNPRSQSQPLNRSLVPRESQEQPDTLSLQFAVAHASFHLQYNDLTVIFNFSGVCNASEKMRGYGI